MDEKDDKGMKGLPEDAPTEGIYEQAKERHAQILAEMTETISVYRDRCHECPISESDIQSIERSMTNLVAIALWHHAEGRNKEMRDVLLVVEEGRSLLAFNWYMHGSIKPASGAKNLLLGPDSERKNEKGWQEKWE